MGLVSFLISQLFLYLLLHLTSNGIEHGIHDSATEVSKVLRSTVTDRRQHTKLDSEQTPYESWIGTATYY